MPEQESNRTNTPTVVLPARIVEVVRLLETVRLQAAKDPKLLGIAARASMLSYEIQRVFSKK